MRDRLLAIVGPTGVGKSALALSLATRFGGEIVSADSRQVYRYMDIGTAKPSSKDRAAVPHHLIDIVDPDQDFSLVMFLRQASEAVHSGLRQPGTTILVGGTGQWVWALLEGWQVPLVTPDADLRRDLEARAANDGYAALHAELARLDPEAATRIDPRNVRRVVRALEVSLSGAGSAPGQPRKRAPGYQTKVVGLTLDRARLYQRIDRRVEVMIESGWLEEVRALLERGYGSELPSMSGLGYGDLVRHIRGELTLEQAVECIKSRTHRFARHQYAWFRPDDKRIAWYDAGTELGRAETCAARWLADAT